MCDGKVLLKAERLQIVIKHVQLRSGRLVLERPSRVMNEGLQILFASFGLHSATSEKGK